MAYFGTEGFECGHAVGAQEALVDRIHLDRRRELPQDAHDPVAHVGIQGVVGGQGEDVLPSACGARCQGSPMRMPSALASLLRALAQPSLLESTTTARPSSFGWKIRSQET